MLERTPAQRIGVGIEQTGDRRRPLRGAVAVNQGAAAAVGHRHRQPAHRRGHHRGTTGLRLDGDKTEGLRVARDGHQIRRPVDVDQLIARLWRQEGDPVGDPQFSGKPDEGVRCGQSAAGGPAGHKYPDVGQQGGGPQQHIRRLERLDAADERHDPVAGGQT